MADEIIDLRDKVECINVSSPHLPTGAHTMVCVKLAEMLVKRGVYEYAGEKPAKKAKK